MADPKGFLKFKRQHAEYRPVCRRVKDWCDVVVMRPKKVSVEQAARCMDCGTPFCHWGCPVSNYISEWNDLLYQGRWAEAARLLEETNNFPEITGRLCPAPCEYSCVLGINDDPVTIRENELAIIEHAFAEGLIRPEPPKERTGKKVAVVGSGPAGLACADQLNKAGHSVTVFERDGKAGGVLRYGIPDFKLEKGVIDRRLTLLKKEGVEFRTGTEVGTDYPPEKLLKDFDAVCLSGGSRAPRDLKIEGRDLPGVYFAMEYLTQSNKRGAGEKYSEKDIIAKGKTVVVIGGGDTGSDCVGTANRQGAKKVIQIELLAKPPRERSCDFPWPKYPMLLKTSSSHEEGGDRKWSILTKKFSGDASGVKKLHCVKVKFEKDPKGCPVMQEVKGSGFEIAADMVVLAMGFTGPERGGLLELLGLEFDPRGNVKTGPDFQTNVKQVFACGDIRRGQSLIVWAISEGRKAAHYIDRHLTGKTALPGI
ncbi:MAG: glutamate synthase subunit beta [Endomicrobiales bacterium]|nr:glutamate synthase subunit beta [Endomicrobiales bacterium]